MQSTLPSYFSCRLNRASVRTSLKSARKLVVFRIVSSHPLRWAARSAVPAGVSWPAGGGKVVRGRRVIRGGGLAAGGKMGDRAKPARHPRCAVFEKTQVRIVAGSLRGRKLSVVVHEGMRPTPQMVREALFS